ncbi:MAG: hypothetical protein ACLUOF_11560 [Ruminococcus sp.]
MFQLTQEEVAKRVGKSRSAVANSAAAETASEGEKAGGGRRPERRTRTLLGISDEKLPETAAKAAEGS